MASTAFVTSPLVAYPPDAPAAPDACVWEREREGGREGGRDKGRERERERVSK